MLSGRGSDVKGWFFDGDKGNWSTSRSFENGSLALNVDSHAGVLSKGWLDRIA